MKSEGRRTADSLQTAAAERVPISGLERPEDDASSAAMGVEATDAALATSLDKNEDDASAIIASDCDRLLLVFTRLNDVIRTSHRRCMNSESSSITTPLQESECNAGGGLFGDSARGIRKDTLGVHTHARTHAHTHTIESQL